MMRKLLRAALGLALLGTILASLYGLGMLAGAVIPRNPDFVSAPVGVQIWVSCSDIHTDIVVPAKNDVFDWTTLVARSDAGTVDQSFEWLAIGWGDRRFYLETPTWSDVKLANVLSAFFGLDETAMHIDWLKAAPAPGEQCRSLTLSPEQYLRLCEFMSASFKRDREQRSLPIDAPGYTETDAFYEATGRYTALRTCNTWSGQALAAGGVRVGCWTPMKWGVLWQIPEQI